MLPPDDFDPPVGIAQELDKEIGHGLRRILAPNASPMTYRGTNTYMIGTRGLAVIDPGPRDMAHLDAILAAVQKGQKITHIFVTHTHVDHSPLAADLALATGAPILAFGDAKSGHSPIMAKLAQNGMAGGGEGIDIDFAPDLLLQDGDITKGDSDGIGWQLRAIHTPGHIGNHLAFAWHDICFTGDHIMGWASSLVSPPDGDLTDFMTSCARLQREEWRVFHSGHGAPITDPKGRLAWLVAHRKTRESDILTGLDLGPATAHALALQIYTETPAVLIPAATRNVFAHLVDLTQRKQVAPHGTLREDAVFERLK